MKLSADPYEVPMLRKHLMIVGGTHLLPLANLFPTYAVSATILIPTQIPEVEAEMEMKRAIQLEGVVPAGMIRTVGMAKDLSGVDTDSVDFLVLCPIYPSTREEFLADAWRVVKEFGKVVIFTPNEIPRTHLGTYGIAAPTYFPVEGFYAGAMRKKIAIRARN